MFPETFLAVIFLERRGTVTRTFCRLGVLVQSDMLTDGDQAQVCFASHHSEPSVSASAAVGFISEDEYLEITGITREQSGEYECSASNDVSAPVVQRVKVTVNCESLGPWGTGVGLELERVTMLPHKGVALGSDAHKGPGARQAAAVFLSRWCFALFSPSFQAPFFPTTSSSTVSINLGFLPMEMLC